MKSTPEQEIAGSFILLPAQQIDGAGRARVDFRAVLTLAVPFIAYSALQVILNLTDTWFVGRLSTEALAAIGAVQRPILIVVLLLGGFATAVQVSVAQSFGAGRHAHSSRAAWIGLWGSLFIAPLLFAIAFGGKSLLTVFGLDAQLQELGGQYWLVRVAGAPLGIATSAMVGFFSGIGRPRVSMLIMLVAVVVNAIFNWIFIFDLQLGIEGAAWATTAAQAGALMMALAIFTKRSYRRRYRSNSTWKVHPLRVFRLFAIGFTMSLLTAADRLAMALFQIMQVQFSAVGGAATQIALTLSSIAYVTGLGIALAGATLVGQSIGAGDRDWAMRVGTRVTLLAVLYMGAMGFLLALVGPWLIPMFTTPNDPNAALVIADGVRVLWLAAICQFFDGLYLGSAYCLRSAGDTTYPAALVMGLAWLLFIPLAYIFTFASGDGWAGVLPHFGWGLLGGWSALVIYVVIVGTALFMRWCSSKWKPVTV